MKNDDVLNAFLVGIIRDVVPKSWDVQTQTKSEGIYSNLIFIDNQPIRWVLNGQELRIAWGTTSMVVNLADPKSKKQLTKFFCWLTNSSRTKEPEGLIIDRCKDLESEYWW